jgi:hypothetical protein
MSKHGKQWLAVIGLYIAATVVGLSAGLGVFPNADASPAYASYHCTRYAPSIKDPDVNCYINNVMGGTGTWATLYTGLRDNNYWEVTASACFYIYYVNYGGTPWSCGSTGATGYGSGGAHVKSACQRTDGNGQTYGNCTTVWHD